MIDFVGLIAYFCLLTFEFWYLNNLTWHYNHLQPYVAV